MARAARHLLSLPCYSGSPGGNDVMANDEQPARAHQGSDAPDAAGTCWTGCPLAPGDVDSPYRPARRHRGDRRLAAPPAGGWDRLGPLEADDLSWPPTRLN